MHNLEGSEDLGSDLVIKVREVDTEISVVIFRVVDVVDACILLGSKNDLVASAHTDPAQIITNVRQLHL